MLRFVLIGLFSTGLYFALLILFEPLIVSIMLLAAFCYVISMAFNFVAQAVFTFQVQRLSPGQLVRYIMMHGLALVLNSISLSLLVQTFQLQLLVAQLFVTIFITVITFTVSKSWVFR